MHIPAHADRRKTELRIQGFSPLTTLRSKLSFVESKGYLYVYIVAFLLEILAALTASVCTSCAVLGTDTSAPFSGVVVARGKAPHP